tara:strand:+ start:854 stop:3013 length:2160 start_codon:yes stop_codon:yes gene_type:complete
MAKYLSPGNYFVEVDRSDYPAGSNSSVVGIVGFASKGPIAGKSGDKATLITSQENLIDTFGEPSETMPGQGIEGGLEILEATNSLYYVRCAATSAAEASAAIPMGACPAISVCATPFGGHIGTADDQNKDYRFTITTYDNVRSQVLDSKVYNVPSGTLSQTNANGGESIDALRKVLGGSLDADRIGAFGTNTAGSGFIVNPIAGSGATMTITMESTVATTPTASDWYGVSGLKPLDMNGNPHPSYNSAASATSSVTASGGTFTDLYYWTRSLYTGAGYNEGTTTAGATSGTSVEVNVNGNSNVVIQVNTEGTAAETFKGGATSSVFLETAIGKTNVDATSREIVAYYTSAQGNAAVASVTSIDNFYDLTTGIGAMGVNTMAVRDGVHTAHTTADPRFIKPVQGTYSLADGDSGIPTESAAQETALIGQIESDGGRSGIEALDDEGVPVKIALAPIDGAFDGVQNALITKAEASQKFLALVSPPYGIGKPSDAIDWTNGKSTDRTAAINSSYGAVHWPWVKTFSVFDGKDRWYAPEIFAARQMAVTDNVARPWFAPAGLQRGRLTKPVDVEVALNQGDRDSLYSGGNIINPITKFDQDGIVIFGQRTAQRTNTATNRINIRRMLIDLRDTVVNSTRQFAFEPNDRFTWDQVVNVVAPILDEMKRERGVTEFKVICDETTNTPIRVDRNELWCKVLLKPTKTAEVVVFEVNVTNQSAQIGN